ncbi:hypothetical protein MANES_02G060400v8 [Manihot esculenta]|uniref:Uncharacterized protein n=1 Tax=Manihot esculenta TaxID=3983 RepID=A0A251LG09_MANES|nr:hypothetical protein MANES_02G060400v8 [Manihot esculenta]
MISLLTTMGEMESSPLAASSLLRFIFFLRFFSSGSHQEATLNCRIFFLLLFKCLVFSNYPYLNAACEFTSIHVVLC